MLSTDMEMIWDEIVERGIATTEELGLACALCGTTMDTLNKVINIRTGYQNMWQIWEEEEEDF